MKPGNYSQKRLDDYLKELGSAAPSPGGGSAAALAAALGMGLIRMVTAINDKRDIKKNPGQAAQAGQKQRVALKLQRAFTASITKDAKVFTKLMKSGGKVGEGKVSQNILKECANVPFEVCLRCSEALNICQGEKNRTSAWLISDLYEAAILLEAAFRAARLNVEINLRSILDSRWVAAIRADTRVLDQKVREIVREILAGCNV